MKKLLVIAAIGLFAASTVLAGAAYAGSGCDGGVALDGDYSSPVTTALDSGTTTPKPKTGS